MSGFRDERGMTLVEVVIVCAIMGVLSLGFATMMKNQTDAQTALRERSERSNMENATRSTAANASAVANSLLVIDP